MSLMSSSRSLRCFSLGALLAGFCLLPGLAFAQICATPGRDGPGTISGVVDTYYPTSGSVSAGATNITLGAASAAGAQVAIAPGDLVLVIQMQDATINSSNNSNYGAGSGTGSGYTGGTAGQYEFAVANSTVAVSGGTLTLTSGLLNAYSNAASTGTQGQKKFQVLRIPQYSSGTLGTTSSNNGTTSGSAPPWDGSTGGVFAVDVAGTLNLGGGSIDVSGLGFRGGGGVQQAGCGGAGCASNTAYRLVSTNGSGGSKGEGIGGTPELVGNQQTSTVVNTGQANDGYPNGSFDRGAPGNAGGGGTDGNPPTNDQNSGGGGGGNGGAGGQGGFSWSSGLNVGGLGGSTVPATATKIVPGGGGGAATDNNTPDYNTSGGAGGGIVLLRAGNVTGSGTINANGSPGQNALNDGGGGGGAGGTVVVAVKSGNLAGLTINANGGVGGNAWPTSAPGALNINEHGPGGGGGGGVVLQSGGATVSVTGGAHGTTTTSQLQFGSTSGASGVSSATTYSALPGASSGAACVPVLTVTKLTTTPSVPDGGTATYTITVKNAAGVASATQVSISDTLPEPITNAFTYKANVTVTLSGSATRNPTSDPTAAAIVPAWGTFSIPANGQVAITFTVSVAYGVPAATYQNPATATYLDPTRTTNTGTTSSNYNPASSTGEDVTVTTAVFISGYVYGDINHNGSLDVGETWTGSTVFVNLILAGAVVQSATVPAGAGGYVFNTVPAGSYTIVLTSSAIATTGTVPAGWVLVSLSLPSISLTTSLSSFQNENFGLYQGNKILGKVFQDNGASGGTPNDGKLNGAETGVGSVPLTVTNGSGTTYDSEVAAGNGSYTLWIPSAATTVVIGTSPPSGYLATGADAGNTAGAYNRAAGTLTFTNTGIVYAGVNFGIVLVNNFSTDNSASALPNSTLFYPHTFQAMSGGQASFSTSAIASPSGSYFAETIYRDVSCAGTMSSGDPEITSAVSLSAGTTICILVKEVIDPGTPLGTKNSITVTVNFTYANASPALSASYTHSDATFVGNSTSAGLDLIKTVDKATAKSGDTLNYIVTFVNDSSGALSNIILNDSTPTYTTFASAACPSTLPSGLTCTITTQPGAGGTGSIRWTFTGILLPAASAQVTYSVKIQ
jgi:uncharacterized repeat protein (TIGR01451 family)